MPAAPKAVNNGRTPKKSTGDSARLSKKSVKSSKPLVLSEDEDSDSDDEGIDEEGMARLMEALGDDGLDAFDKAQLDLALGDEGDQWTTDEEGEGDYTASEEGGSDAESIDEGVDNDQEDSDDSQEESDEDEESGELETADKTADQGEDIALDDVESVNEDAVPRQKIEIDNEVRFFLPRDMYQMLKFKDLGCSTANSRVHPARSLLILDRNLGPCIPSKNGGRCPR